jgi:ketosteroid isomerase-like protein
MKESENLGAVRRAYDSFARDDVASLHAALADDFEWSYLGPGSIPWAGTYRGREGFDRFFEVVRAHVALELFAPQQFWDAGETIIVMGMSRGRILATNVVYEATWINLFALERGRVKKLVELYDTATLVAALEAADV